MAESEKKASKKKIAAGMAEAGKGQVKGGGEAGRGGPGHGADPGKLTEGMAEAGSGSLTAPRFLLAATLLCACGGTQEVRAQAAGQAPPQVHRLCRRFRRTSRPNRRARARSATNSTAPRA